MQKNESSTSILTRTQSANVQHNDHEENASSDSSSQCTVNFERSAELRSHMRGRREDGDGNKDEASVARFSSLFYLSPSLIETFAALGGTSKAYTFNEVLQLLKKYLLSKPSLCDPNNVLYVNCGDDSLGQALGVERFHFKDVKLLVSRNIIPAHEVTYMKSLPLFVSGSSRQERIIDPDSVNYANSQSTAVKTDNNVSVNNISETNGKTALPADDCLATNSKPSELGSASTTLNSEHVQGCLTTSPGPGSSRQKPEESLPCRKNHEQVVPSISFSRVLLPSHPSTGSESESVYSCQGYETALCLNSEYVENEEECGEDIEDASESGKDLKHLDDDASSVMENVGAAVLALHALCGSEREFWPDDNDTDESTDEDPELVADHWKCLTCDEKNKPFVRYCSKCWQLRKNWLPERPKRRKRRKPRPKNKHKKHQTNAIPKWENYPIQSPLDPSAYSDLLKENTIPSTSFSMDCCRSQDSGIFLSQDNLTDFSQELKREDSQSSNLGNNLTDFLPENLGSVSHQDIHEILNKKSACFMVTRESSAAPQAFDGESKDQENEINNFFKFLLSKAGKEWLNSAAGRCFLASPEVKEVIRRRLRHSSAASEVSQSTNLVSVLCSVCHVRPKNALIIHGRVAHLVACYQCAHHLLERGSRCPACRRKIHMVCKQM